MSWAEICYVPVFLWKRWAKGCCHQAASCRAGRQLSLPPCSVHLKAALACRLRTSHEWLWSHVAGGRHVLWEKTRPLGEDTSFGRRKAALPISQCSRSPNSRAPVSLKAIPHRYTGSAHVSRLPSCETRVLAMREGGDSQVHIWTSPKTKSTLDCSQQLRSICGTLSLDFTSFSHSNQSLGGGEDNCNTWHYSFQTEQTLFNDDQWQGQDLVRSMCESWLLQGSKFAK